MLIASSDNRFGGFNGIYGNPEGFHRGAPEATDAKTPKSSSVPQPRRCLIWCRRGALDQGVPSPSEVDAIRMRYHTTGSGSDMFDRDATRREFFCSGLSLRIKGKQHGLDW